MASNEFIKEFWNFCEFAWPLLLSIIIWLVVSFSPNPPQRRFENELKTTVKNALTFKSIDDSFFPQSHAFLPDSRYRFRRKKYEKKKRWSSSISLTSASTDLYFGRSTSLIFDKQQIFSSLCDSGHVSLRESIESLPNYSSLDKEFIEIQQFVNELNKNLENLSPGRNLLNKKEAPPSTIKESSESSQTIDEQDGEKGDF
uniref:ATP synthase F0 subunit 8 n=1 Tax=Panagrolaimus sp. PS1159 TaxID=55785 RepID=A0AC35GDW6_9BILA